MTDSVAVHVTQHDPDALDYSQVVNLVMLDPRLSPAARCLYAILVSYAKIGQISSGQQHDVYPSQKRIAAQMGKSVDVVQRLMKELEGAGVITRARQYRKNGTRAVDLIHLHDRQMLAAHKAAETRQQEREPSMNKKDLEPEPSLAGCSGSLRSPGPDTSGPRRTSAVEAYDKAIEANKRAARLIQDVAAAHSVYVHVQSWFDRPNAAGSPCRPLRDVISDRMQAGVSEDTAREIVEDALSDAFREWGGKEPQPNKTWFLEAATKHARRHLADLEAW
ncbi:helix-turn-helix domain-containing protein [Nostocoides japonicum]|uniref:helix-turn-helix domain-containing protein n=1 Tax=Nostocoides japonicum TaxID=99481 RepID=UPI00065BB009|nr:helix-turn-helix domain-containing protein [Tetrasphaera japonica]